MKVKCHEILDAISQSKLLSWNDCLVGKYFNDQRIKCTGWESEGFFGGGG